MGTQTGWTQELRKRVTAAFGDRNRSFQFTEFVEEFGLDRDTADAVAETLYSRTYVQCLDDQVISRLEGDRLRRLAELLEIADERRVALSTLAGKEAYRAQYTEAMQDGTISDAEREQLQQLLGALATQEADDEKPSASEPVTNSVSPQSTVGATTSKPSKGGRDELVKQALALGITGVNGKNMAVLRQEIASVSGGELGTVAFDEAGFQKTFVYKSNASPATVIAQLSSMRHMDKRIEETRKRYALLCLAGAGATVLGVILCFAAAGNPNFKGLLLALGGPLMPAGLTALIWGFICLIGSSMRDVPDRRYEAALGILKLVSKDLARDSLVNIQLDCRPHNHETKKVRTGKVHYWNVKFHVDSWLVLRGSFADGTKFTMMMIEKHQDRSRRKRSASGKIKHKSKTKTSSEAILELKIKPKKNPELVSGWQGKAKSKTAAVRLPEWTQRKSLDAQGDRIKLRSTTKSSWDAVNPSLKGGAKVQRDGVKWMAMMFLSLYGVLDATRSNQKESKS
jgi:hypothetical protein